MIFLLIPILSACTEFQQKEKCSLCIETKFCNNGYHMIYLQVVRVWDPRSGSKTMKLKGHTDNIRALLLDSSGRLVLRSIDFYMEMFLEIFCILFCTLGFVLVYQTKGRRLCWNGEVGMM